MKLKGKAESDFLNWFLSKNYDHKKNPLKVGLGYSIMAAFHFLPENMKWGVYVDFFDSVGIYISDPKRTTGKGFGFQLTSYIYSIYETRPEARNAAIEKANEIYNSQ